MGHLEIHKVLVLSTAHMTEEDSVKLQAECGPAHYELGEYGWLVLVDAKVLERSDITEFSYGFKQSVLLAQGAGCDWLRFDRDANKIDSVVTYEW